MSRMDLTSKEWCDLVFEGKNKEYGAYKLRQGSTKRHIKALIVVLIAVIVAILLPILIKAVTPKHTDQVAYVDQTQLADLEELEQEKEPEEPQEPLPELPPPPPEVMSVKYTPPVITDQPIAKEDEMKSIEEVVDKKDAAVASTDNVDGIKLSDANVDDLKTLDEPVHNPDVPVDFVEQMPEYPGGEAEMRSFIAKNLRYPRAAQEEGIQGRVTVRFVVSKTGEITDIKIVRGIHTLCDEEAIRVVKMMPNWIPGRQNGNPVAVIYNVPVVFKLM